MIPDEAICDHGEPNDAAIGGAGGRLADPAWIA